MTAGAIHVGEPRVHGNRVVVPLTAEGKRARRVLVSNYFAEYAFDLSDVPPQILNLAALARMLPISWAEDLELTTETVDATFLTAVPRIREAWRAMYPRFGLRGSFEAGVIASTTMRIQPGLSLLLCSGGVDSTATAVVRRRERLLLVPIWGLDTPVGNRKAWQPSLRAVLQVAEMSRADVSPVRTNVKEFVDEPLLNRAHQRGDSHWWRASLGPVQLTLTAPIALRHGAGTVYIAASHDRPAVTQEYGTHPTIDNEVRFAEVSARHEHYPPTRAEKIALVAREAPGHHLIVCRSAAATTGLNCLLCEKCIRTAVGLLAAGADPADHGLAVASRTFSRFIRRVDANRGPSFSGGLEYQWLTLKQMAEGRAEPSDHEVIEWLRGVDAGVFAARPESSPWRRVRGMVGRIVPRSVRPLARRVYLRAFKHW